MYLRINFRQGMAGLSSRRTPDGHQRRSATPGNRLLAAFLLVLLIATALPQPAVADCEMAWDAMGLRYRDVEGQWRYFTPGLASGVVVSGTDGKKEWTFNASLLDQQMVDRIVGAESDCRHVLGVLYAQRAGLMYRDSERRPLPGLRIPLVAFSPGKFSTGQKRTWMCTTDSTHFIEGKPPTVVTAANRALPLIGASDDDVAGLDGLAAELIREVRDSGVTQVRTGKCEISDGEVEVTLAVKGDRQKRRQLTITWPAASH